jgi:predicted enzyme related to lactoylglutathione lyase
MTDERSYPAGVPCWVDTDQPNVDAARDFYAGLFGWTFSDAVPPEAPGTYLIASLDGADVAAIGPAEGGAGAPPGFEDAIGWLVPVDEARCHRRGVGVAIRMVAFGPRCS